MQWVKIGAASGAGVGLALVIWNLVILPPPVKHTVGFTPTHLGYLLANAALWAFLGALPGVVIGGLVGAVLGDRKRDRGRSPDTPQMQ